MKHVSQSQARRVLRCTAYLSVSTPNGLFLGARPTTPFPILFCLRPSSGLPVSSVVPFGTAFAGPNAVPFLN